MVVNVVYPEEIETGRAELTLLDCLGEVKRTKDAVPVDCPQLRIASRVSPPSLHKPLCSFLDLLHHRTPLLFQTSIESGIYSLFFSVGPFEPAVLRQSWITRSPPFIRLVSRRRA